MSGGRRCGVYKKRMSGGRRMSGRRRMSGGRRCGVYKKRMRRKSRKQRGGYPNLYQVSTMKGGYGGHCGSHGTPTTSLKGGYFGHCGSHGTPTTSLKGGHGGNAHTSYETTSPIHTL